MNKTLFKVRHIRCNMADFNADRHRFRFEYDGHEYVAECYGKVSVSFEPAAQTLPKEVLSSVQSIIYKKIDKEESRWGYPDEAYAIADAYCQEEFN